MEKTKLGISVGLLGALLYFSGLFSGYIITIVIAGYVLIAEEDTWLRKTAVRAVALLVTFSLINTLLGIIPDLFGLLNSLLRIFDEYVSVPFIDNFFNLIINIVSFVKMIAFLLLGASALKKFDFKFPIVDDLIK